MTSYRTSAVENDQCVFENFTAILERLAKYHSSSNYVKVQIADDLYKKVLCVFSFHFWKKSALHSLNLRCSCPLVTQ